MAPPHDIKGVVAVLPAWLPWLAIALLIALIGITVFFLLRSARARRGATRAAVTSEPVLERVTRELNALDVPVPFAGVAREDFFAVLTRCVREAIAAGTPIAAVATTVREISPKLMAPHALPLGVDAGALVKFLETAELVKFGGGVSEADLSPEHGARHLADARAWVAQISAQRNPFLQTGGED